MNKEQTAAIMTVLKTAYPMYYSKMSVTNMQNALNLWTEMFANDDAKIVTIAVKDLIQTHTGFPPDIAAVKNHIKEIVEAANGEPTNEELWSIWRKALSNGVYGAKEEFDKLPPVLKRYAVNPSGVYHAALDESPDSVKKGLFFKQISVVKERQDFDKRLGKETKEIINKLFSKMQTENELMPGEWNDRRNDILNQLEEGEKK